MQKTSPLLRLTDVTRVEKEGLERFRSDPIALQGRPTCAPRHIGPLGKNSHQIFKRL